MPMTNTLKPDLCNCLALRQAARQGADVKASFEAGINEHLEMLGRWVGKADGEEPGAKAMATLSTMVGALLLSRVVNDERLSKRFLQAAAESVLLGAPPRAARPSSRSSAGSRKPKAGSTRTARRHVSS